MKRLVALIMAVGLSVSLMASNPLTAASKLAVHRDELSARKCSPGSQSSTYQAFIGVDHQDLIELQKLGVKVNGNYGQFVTAIIPSHLLNDVLSLKCVHSLSLAKQLQLHNDSARILSCIDHIHGGHGLMAPFTGKGVIVGIVDTGIDFNHINFRDNNGQSRVKAVYLPCDSTGDVPVIGCDTLPGSCFESYETIAALSTDYNGTSHGTHTLGTAAGSFYQNGWHGMAPDADIVACGMPSNALTDVNLANALKYIFNYAERVGKPCVVNMSIGTNEGPNDGTSFLCRTFASISGPGRICVLSAGNDGNVPVHFSESLNGANDTVTTLLRGNGGSLQRTGYVSMWSDESQIHHTRIVVVNRETRKIEFASPWLGVMPDDSVFTLSSDVNRDFADYYTGEIMFANAQEPQFSMDGSLTGRSRFHSICAFEATANQSTYLLGLQFTSSEAVQLVGWSTKDTYFYTFDLEGITGGTSSGSISDLVTCDSVISVGAYCSRKSFIDSGGELYSYNRCNPNDIAYFSSYGPDERGIDRPDVCAPGFAVISSANRYHDSSSYQHVPPSAIVNDVEYPYSVIYGTSMSSPVVAGAIALMLQLNPSLTPSGIKNILKQSSVRDDYVTAGDPSRWGYGKLDALAAMNAVIDNSFLPGDVNNDGEVNIADITAIVNIIIDARISTREPSLLVRADVNRDLEIQLTDINSIIDLIIK